MMFKKNYKLTFSATLISIIGFGCSAAPESNSAKTGNTNQAVVVSNNNAAPPSTPTAVVDANSPAANNNQTANVSRAARTPPGAVNQPVPKIGSGGDDLSLFAQVRNAFSADPELFNGVIVEIKEGNAVLSGKVTSAEKKKKAEQLVQSINGIKSVKNIVVVAP